MSELTNKKQMRIALVGITPADQVTLKGYMRVLLRLDVNLEWVAASDGNINLFMINHDFRNAESVVRLLDLHKTVPVLYVATSPTEEGGIQQNLLTLPLKQINLLSHWLAHNVPALAGTSLGLGSGTIAPATPAPQPVTTPSNTQSTQPNIGQIRTIQGDTNANSSMQAIIDLIEKLHSRNKSLFEITENGVSVAVIDGYRQMAWVQSAHATLSNKWQLRPYHGAIPTSTPQDANAWLWAMAWKTPSIITSLINSHSRYQLRYWIKPALGQDRRDLLQIMTAMENTALSVAEIAAKAGVSSVTTKNAVASLLLSGNLTADSYKEIKVQAEHLSQTPQSTTSTPTPTTTTPTASPSPQPVRTEPPKPAPKPEQEEKLGFLAKLRKKLGL